MFRNRRNVNLAKCRGRSPTTVWKCPKVPHPLRCCAVLIRNNKIFTIETRQNDLNSIKKFSAASKVSFNTEAVDGDITGE